MKTTTFAVCVVAFVVLAGLVARIWAVDNTITNYIPGYLQVSSTTTNAGDTGLSTGVVYLCFPQSNVTSISVSQSEATTNGSMSQLIYAMTHAWYSALQAEDYTNRPTRVVVGRSTASGDQGDLMVIFTVKADMSATGVLEVVEE